ncbi:MAG TPA: AMP-dependent synthetase [Oceanospirillaceae bacterium]|nr:AMP-dependent synthetase [Oceanospirillaceae bacterium]
MTNFYDDLETRSAQQREADQIAAVAAQVAHAKASCSAWADILADVDAADINSAEAIAQLPVTRKSALIELQKDKMPFGGMVDASGAHMNYVFTSPGPIYEPGFDVPDAWRFARALHAGGLRRGDLVQNCFSYHFTPAGAMFDNAAKEIGCTVIAAGVGNTEMQAQSFHNLKPTAYIGTPSFLKIILEKADELGLDASSVTKAVVGGEPFLPPLQAFFKERGIQVLQGYATADLGNIAYEVPGAAGMLLDEGIYLEIVRPGTGDPVAPGEVGEIVVTTFNAHYPLIRFATGDMSAFMDGESPCGRTSKRIKGWMGRADQSTKVRGMFVRPEQVAELAGKHDEIGKIRLSVDQADGKDSLLVACETDNPSDALLAAVTDNVRNVIHLRGDVQLVAVNSLPNDGKVIDDKRQF